MTKTSKYKGKKRALSRGHYRWYVYPGLGKRSANKYGPLIGSSDFYVTKKRWSDTFRSSQGRSSSCCPPKTTVCASGPWLRIRARSG
jgi:hypothetical protein